MIAAAPSKVVYLGDGVSTVFGYTMALPTGSDGSELQVWVFDDAVPQNAYLLDSNYSVDVDADTVSYPTVGGVSPLGPGVNALPLNWQLVIARVVPLSQILSILTQGVFDGPSFEQAFDRLTMIAQQLQEQLNRAVLLPINSPVGEGSAIITPTAGVLITYRDTFANLQTIAAAAPTVQFWGYATDQSQLYFYTGNVALGDGGFITA